MNRQGRPSDEELQRERLEVFERIHHANKNLMDRAIDQGVTFHLDADNTLRITIGMRPVQFYTQRDGPVRINLDRASDEIVGFVIERVDDYLDAHPASTGGFHALLPALRRLGVVQLPPQTPSTEALREDFSELLPA